MAFIKSLLSKVTIAVAAGAAEQSVRHAVSDAWNKRKQNKNGEQDAALGDVDTKPVHPVKRFFSDKMDEFRKRRAATEYVKQQKSSGDEEPTDEN
jgi:hypothetical protein